MTKKKLNYRNSKKITKKKIQTGGESTLLIRIHDDFKSIIDNRGTSEEIKYYVQQLTTIMNNIAFKKNVRAITPDSKKNITLFDKNFNNQIKKQVNA